MGLATKGFVKSQVNAVDSKYAELITSGTHRQGLWNAETNTPTLSPNSGTNGYWYDVSVEGDWDGRHWRVGDRIIFNSAINKWDQIPTGVEKDDQPMLIGFINENSLFPTTRPSGKPLLVGDYLKVDSAAVLPFEIDDGTGTKILFDSYMDEAEWNGSRFQEKSYKAGMTNEIGVKSPAKESPSGQSEYQNDINQEIVEITKKLITFRGYICEDQPVTNIKGSYWYQGSLPDAFPIQVKTFDGTEWSDDTQEYTPVNFDLFTDLNENKDIYWFNNKWNFINNKKIWTEVDNLDFEGNEDTLYYLNQDYEPAGDWPGLKFTSQQDGSTVGYTIRGTVNKDIYYSLDGKTWTSWNGSNITLNDGQSIYIWNKTNTLSTSGANFLCFTMSGSIAASGNVNSMINFSELTDCCYNKMFYNCSSLTTAPDLPGTTMFMECYAMMFSNCHSLTTAPELPATNLAPRCYGGMFQGCNNLITAPELPATNLAPRCYDIMFEYCVSLYTAPELPATTLAVGCYTSMFKNCRILTTAPDLPATTLADYCYAEMFSGCNALNSIKLSYTGNFSSNYFNNWVYNVSQTGTLYYNGSDTTRGGSAIPVGWVKRSYLKFTSNQDGSTLGYNIIFINPGEMNIDIQLSTDSINWTVWDGTTITLNNGESVYVWNKTNRLSSELRGHLEFTMSGSISASGNVNSMINFSDVGISCYYRMFMNCTSLTTAPELPSTILAESCYKEMFSYCASLMTAPDLPATTLPDSCYSGMFSYCASLMTAPDLPATTLDRFCYTKIFEGCSNLNSIKLSYTGNFDYQHFYDWAYNISPTGTIYYNGSDTTRGDSAIPNGWTVEQFVNS